MRPLIAGNWKMHGLRAELHEIELIAALATRAPPHVDIRICPPASACRGGADSGWPNRHRPAGSSPRSVRRSYRRRQRGDAQRRRSERRHRRTFGAAPASGETDALVARKALAARRAGLIAILCGWRNATVARQRRGAIDLRRPDRRKRPHRHDRFGARDRL